MTQRPLTVVIATLNEESVLGETLRYVNQRAARRPRVVVVDGGSTDSTRRVARQHGAHFRYIQGGRGAQQNGGAALAPPTADVLFLHADTHVPSHYDSAIAATLDRPHTVCGAFPLHIRGATGALRVVQWGANFRARFLQRPYGDQALFIRRCVFDEVGGFQKWSFLEDLEFVRRVSRRGMVRIADAAPVSTDDRRWRALGVVRTTLINQAILIGYTMGVPISRLCEWYRGALRRTVEH